MKFKMKVASDLCVNIEYRYFFIAFIILLSVLFTRYSV